MHLYGQEDSSLANYLVYLCYVKDADPSQGDACVHGLVYLCPEFSAQLPRAWRGLNSWKKMLVAGEGLCELNFTEEADPLLLAWDCYLRGKVSFSYRPKMLTCSSIRLKDLLQSVAPGVDLPHRIPALRWGLHTGQSLVAPVHPVGFVQSILLQHDFQD